MSPFGQIGLVISDTTLAIIVATVPLTITSIASLIVSIRNGGKSDKIASAVDGTASKLQTDLATANGMIQQLIRFYPAGSSPGLSTESDAPAKVEIVQPDEKPIPAKIVSTDKK